FSGVKWDQLGCGEGGCGACTVMLSKFDRLQKKIVHFSVNACLAPICSLHHVAVTTVEGIGSTKTRLHPVQERISKSHGSQCGFCTPGIVMSMYTLLRNNPEPTMEEIENAFQGLPSNPMPSAVQGSTRELEILHTHIHTKSREEFLPLDPTQEPIFPPELMVNEPQKQLCFQGERVKWIQTATLKELLELKAEHPDAKLVVGNTEIGKRAMPRKGSHKVKLIGRMTVASFLGISFGAACPLSEMEKALVAAIAELPSYQTEVFKGVLEQLRWFAGKQVKSVAVSLCVKDSLTPRTRVFAKFSDHYTSTLCIFQGEYFSAFKQASRREDDIAKVTCGMRVLFKPESDQVQELDISFGGMADKTIPALKTTRKQQGRAWNEELLQEVCASLAEELSLEPDAPGGMVEFRRTLTLSFFFKFYLTVLQKLGKDSTDVSEGRAGLVVVPLGSQLFCDDIPPYSNELYLRLVTSTKAHARIKSIDISEAQKVPGFIHFLSADDIPGSNETGLFNDETVFAKHKVTCVGHIIGAVVTDTPEHAQRAAQAVKIEYEELPAIITIEVTDLKIEKGDLKKGFAEADNVVSGELYIGGQEHFYLETHCTIAVPKGEEGEMELFVSTQNTMKTQSFVAKVLGVPDNRIVVRVKRMGGGFGGKETRSTVLSTAVALAAYKTGRPVRCMLDRDEDMLITGGRHPFLARYKVGFMKTGKIVALEVEHYSNAGNTLDLSQSIMERALFHMDNCYKIPNIRGIGRLCKTNLSSNTAFRGFGGPQGMLIAEYWMSEVALTCRLPAEEVRRLNMYKEGDLTHFNQKLEGFTLPRCWDECLESSKYHARRNEIETFNKENCWKKRGLCIIPTKFGISFTAGALVHVYTDGSVLLTHGGTEMGQGLHTKMIQVASKALKIPTSKIYISETSTSTVPNTSPTAASVSADINGQAVYEACKTILQRLEPFKKKNPNGSWKDWVSLTPNLGYSFETNSGNPFHYFSYGVACSEVEIDCLTGDHKNIRTDIVMDVGSSLNPAIDIGQVEGAFVQGLGLFTLEELHYSPEGTLHTRGPSTYKIPAFGNIPIDFRVSLLRDCPNKKAIYASKAVGEPPLFLASSIFFAIKDAICAARAQHADFKMKELFQLDSPATPEKIRNACVDKFTTLEGSIPWDILQFKRAHRL
uniref:xanthine dehydrogenase n=1 Tax=Monodelphis domestica TaxID=13616 RepID=A0A5F8H074_MONDO